MPAAFAEEVECSRRFCAENGDGMVPTGAAGFREVSAFGGVEKRRGNPGMRRLDLTAIHGGPKGELRTNPTGKRGVGEKGARGLTGGPALAVRERGGDWEPSKLDPTAQDKREARLSENRPI